MKKSLIYLCALFIVVVVFLVADPFGFFKNSGGGTENQKDVVTKDELTTSLKQNERSDYDSIKEKTDLKTYLKFVADYPDSTYKNDLKKRLKARDKNLPPEKHWAFITKNSKGYYERKYAYGIAMVYIPAGEFIMGSDGKIYKDEKPVHKVTLDGYWIGKCEVTFEQYDKYCAETGKDKPVNKGWGRGDRPVIHVSWHDAIVYCKWLNKKPGLNFRLPTEAQWEKAARGTDGRKYPWGNEFDKNKCNSWKSGLKRTAPAGSYPSGASHYGCLDMAGNVWEWCSDWYDENYYEKSPYKNPTGPAGGSDRVLRGGSWYFLSVYVRCAFRFRYGPAFRDYDVGFRLCLESYTK